MVKILVDTCVWLDLAKQPDQIHFINVLDNLIDMKYIELIIPEPVLLEFNANKERVIKDNNKGLSNIIKRAKQVVDVLEPVERRKMMIDQLDDVNFKLPGLQQSSLHAISAIEKLLLKSPIIPITNDIILKAALRACNKLAPFHRSKNSMHDAIIMETYGKCVLARKNKHAEFIFVSHNVTDFSLANGNANEPHGDFAEYFNRKNSSYSIDLVKTVKSLDSELFEELMLQEIDFEDEPRLLSEILKEENILFEKVWYNRHLNTIYEEYGDFKERREHPGYTAAKRIIKEHGKKNLGPWDDFEWGMLNGKLSALRWILGDEWDMLDT